MRTKNKAFPEILDAKTFRIRWKIFLAAFKVALDVENPASPVKSICFSLSLIALKYHQKTRFASYTVSLCRQTLLTGMKLISATACT